MGTVETGTLSQLLLAIPLQISAGCRCCWSQSRMKILLLAAALVSQVVGRPQQGEYQPGNGWGNTRPAQPTQWSAWSSGGGAAPTSYNSYDSYNSYNPYNPYNSYVPGGNKQPYLRSNSYDSYMPVPMPQPMQPGNCGSGGCGQMPQPSRCQLGSGPQMGPLLGPIATTGCGASDRDMPTFGAPSNGWMPGTAG